MMMLILAWKNIWRNKKRSVIILAATTIGLAAGLFTVGMINGMYESIVYTTINREVGNLQIHTAEYKKDQLIGQYIPEPDSVFRTVRLNPNVRSAAGHSLIEGMASSATASSGIMIYGINPEEEKQVTSISQSIIEGKYLDSSDKSNSIIIGKKLSEKLKLKLRSRIVLSFAGIDGNIIYAAFRISGIFRTDASTFDGANVFLQQKDLTGLMETEAPIHEIIIRTKDSNLLEKTKHDLQKKMRNGTIVETWKEIAPEIKYTADSSDIVNAIFLGVILFALLFGLTNTLLMSVIDRVKDFGVLLAVGMYRRRLFLMIVLESLLLSFTGGIVGAAIGWIVTAYFNVHGIDLSIISTGLSAFGIPSMLYPFIPLSVYSTLTIMVIIMSIIAALYPAVKAVRLKPVQAIRTIA
ncbi:MAG TPA: FtsX-like permease family protein [Ignavibacteriaceae bacterium]|jgi:ABC-type lipoprotein release transport system permease subunit|nr:FtsX-like permease family protein [Ignavibacteriaceae bacterium]